MPVGRALTGTFSKKWRALIRLYSGEEANVLAATGGDAHLANCHSRRGSLEQLVNGKSYGDGSIVVLPVVMVHPQDARRRLAEFDLGELLISTAGIHTKDQTLYVTGTDIEECGRVITNYVTWLNRKAVELN